MPVLPNASSLNRTHNPSIPYAEELVLVHRVDEALDADECARGLYVHSGSHLPEQGRRDVVILAALSCGQTVGVCLAWVRERVDPRAMEGNINRECCCPRSCQATSPDITQLLTTCWTEDSLQEAPDMEHGRDRKVTAH